MTPPKVDKKRAQALMKVVRYVLDVHEWCEMPRRTFPCGHEVTGYCTPPDLCDGCRMREKAERAAGWEGDHR